jgi:hypothetical protein
MIYVVVGLGLTAGFLVSSAMVVVVLYCSFAEQPGLQFPLDIKRRLNFIRPKWKTAGRGGSVTALFPKNGQTSQAQRPHALRRSR